MDRFDIVVTGLDPERDKWEVISAIARRLVRSTVEVEDVLDHAPAILVHALSTDDATKLVAELRELGARVKPQAEGGVLPPEPAEPDKKIDLLYWSPDDDGYERPVTRAIAIEPAIEEASAVEEAKPEPKIEAPVEAPTPIVVKSAEWFQQSSRTAPAALGPEAPPLAITAPLPSPARFGRTASEVRTGPTRPRVFFRALPRVLLLPLRRPLVGSLALAATLLVASMTLAVIGLRTASETGAFLLALAVGMAIGFVGLAFQLAGACFAAALDGAAKASELPGRLMEDYLRPGALVLFVIGAITALTAYATLQLARIGAPLAAVVPLWIVVALYTVIGFALAGANGSASAYLDVARIARLVVGSPIRASVVGAIGTLTLGGSAIAEIALIDASRDAPLPLAILYVGVLGSLAALVASYGAALTGGATGALIFASTPD